MSPGASPSSSPGSPFLASSVPSSPAVARPAQPPAPPPAGDAFGSLDVEMARAVAAKLSEALQRYATPALIPLVIEQMAEMLDNREPPDEGPG